MPLSGEWERGSAGGANTDGDQSEVHGGPRTSARRGLIAGLASPLIGLLGAVVGAVGVGWVTWSVQSAEFDERREVDARERRGEAYSGFLAAYVHAERQAEVLANCRASQPAECVADEQIWNAALSALIDAAAPVWTYGTDDAVYEAGRVVEQLRADATGVVVDDDYSAVEAFRTLMCRDVSPIPREGCLR